MGFHAGNKKSEGQSISMQLESRITIRQ